MGNQWGDIYLCVHPTTMLGGVSPRPPYNRRPCTKNETWVNSFRGYSHLCVFNCHLTHYFPFFVNCISGIFIF